MPISPTGLTVEHLTSPVGVDKPNPRFSWRLSAPEDRKNVRQTAYQLRLSHNGQTLWDTGKVASSNTLDIPYAGKPLPPHAALNWQVKVWDEANAPTQEATSTFSTGYLPSAPWQPTWIGFDTPAERARKNLFALDDASWIRHPDDEGEKAPAGTRAYTSTFTPPEGVTAARILITADDEFVLYLNDKQIAESKGRDAWRKAQVHTLLPHLRAGVNDLRIHVRNATEGPTALIAKLEFTTASGVSTHVTDGSWKAINLGSSVNAATQPIATQAAPQPAKVMGAYGIEPWKNVRTAPFLPPPVLFRKEFTAAKAVKRATLYTTALGLADAYLNGARVSDDLFNPGWTDYRIRTYYRAYDVTSRVKSGANVLGAALAEGWFSGHVGWDQQRDHYGKHPRLAASLRVEYTDGTTDTIATDPTWTASTGPYLYSDFLQGEYYDARKRTDWTSGSWAPVTTGLPDMTPTRLQWHPAPPVTAFEEFHPVSIKEPKPKVYVLDLGQNFAGFARLKLKNLPSGTTVTLRFAERLNPDGTIYTTNLRAAACTDTYVTRGDKEETWSPRFTFHGFQYVEVTGLPTAPDQDTVTGVAISSATPVVGTFESSDAMLNRLYKNIYHTQRMNFIELPTDCPQRDERLGWTADAQVYFQAGTLNTDLQAFMDKWLQDLIDAQDKNGDFPKVAPKISNLGDGGPAWADAGTVVPFEHYLIYGDRQQLARAYPHMAAFVDYTRSRCTPNLLPPPKYHCYGDWLSIKADTPHDVIFMAYFARSADLTAKAAKALGKTDDAAKYSKLFEDVKTAFYRTYVDHNYKITGHTQCAYVLALAFDLLDGQARQAAIDYLVKDIESRGNHLSTGFVGTKELMPVLSKIGRTDLAMTLLHNTTFPSWGFSIQHGATSIWERWDGWTPDKGFQDSGMNSFAHYSFGAVYRWMAETLGGISQSPDSLAFSHPRIAPTFDPKLSHCTTTYTSPQGLISSAWKREGGNITWTLTLPPNTTSTVIARPNAAPQTLGSGTYTFTFNE